MPIWDPTPVLTVPITSRRDRAKFLSAPLLGLLTPSRPPSAPKADLGARGAGAEKHFGDSAARVVRTPTGKGSK